MAKIVKYQEIPLDDLVLDQAQVRVSDLGAGIDELKQSIEVQGLLQPIVVCLAKQEGKYEILSGQRRFLAHKYLKRKSISAAIIDERVDAAEAKAISITENLMRRKLSGKELKDGIQFLYNKYGSLKDVVQATGLPYQEVRANVFVDRLIPELKEVVQAGVDVNLALKAQDAATPSDYAEADADVAIKLVEEMSPMTDVQRKLFLKEYKDSPDEPIDDVLERAKTGAQVSQFTVTITHDTHRAITKYANSQGKKKNEAAVDLIESALCELGFLEDGEA